ncbi:hypothetical protein Q8A73_014504 [Channa argus]|nr:hypothetical protein Q8A73_014504 [Channa argus]
MEFAYRPNRSTDDAISTTLHLALTHLDNKDSYIRMLFIVFSSAFNTIIPQHLIEKLSILCLNTSLCNWILDFLTGRPQSVRIGNNISSTTTLSTGAPQGCVLSPLLFTLLTHDCVAKHSSNHIVKFADDTTVVGPISKNDESAYREVQRSSNNMSCSRLSTALLLAAAGLLVGSGFSEAEQDFASTLPTVSTERAITCDDLYNVQQLSCDSGVISVQAALYGRADSKTCSEGWSPQQLSNTNCAQQGTTSVLKERCDGKRVCQINTNVLRTSDPCYGIYKYLDTIYTCIAEKRSVTCEGSVLNLQCDKGKVLYIHSADYGRHDQTTCSYQRPAGQVQNVQCSRASNIVAQSCNGRNSCTVSASNSVFGDPCVGTYKYLEVAYICYFSSEMFLPVIVTTICSLSISLFGQSKTYIVAFYPFYSNTINSQCVSEAPSAEQDFASTLPTVSTERAITCDDLYNVQQLSCDSGVISVQAALYGRADSKTCSEGWSPQQLSNTNCAQQGTTSVLKERCDGKRVCQINTNVLRTSDPCYGIYKYLDTIYTCIAEKRSVTCEGSVLNLQCDKGKVLYIHSADYGRHDQTTCSYQRPAGQVQNVQCSRASNIVAQSCNGRNSCTVSASNSVFGDPCVGTYKYLEVAYICYWPPTTTTTPTSTPSSNAQFLPLGLGIPLVVLLLLVVFLLFYQWKKRRNTSSDKELSVTYENWTPDPGCEHSIYQNLHPTNQTQDQTAANILQCGKKQLDGNQLVVSRLPGLLLVLAAAGLLVGSGFSEAEQDFASTLPTVSTERAITCDDLYNVQQLSCDSGVISVQAALYGRADSKTCSEGWSPQQLSNTNCAQQGTTSVLKERCDGKRVCQINTNVLRTSDPCYGIYKYLDTIYTCIAEKRSVTCEGSVLNLQCDKGKVLYIHSADYGRHDQTTCSYQRPAGQVQNVQCSRASNIVAQSCNGRNSCTVSASNSVFGDPCVGTYKYLEVAYICYCPQLPAKN